MPPDTNPHPDSDPDHLPHPDPTPDPIPDPTPAPNLNPTPAPNLTPPPCPPLHTPHQLGVLRADALDSFQADLAITMAEAKVCAPCTLHPAPRHPHPL